MNPSFGPVQVRELVPIFWQKSNKLRDAWVNLIKSGPEEHTIIDVLSWLSRATLDIIGVAGFDYEFSALDGNDEDELSKAFNKAFESGQHFNTLAILRPDELSRGRAASMETMRRIGMRLIFEKKDALEHDLKTGSTSHGRDLLTLLIKSNMAHENVSYRMSDDEVLEISTFITAGHETTSTSTTWALYVLTKHPEVQRKLRQELLESRLGEEPSMNELDKLPYLDNFVRECLRVHPAVPSTVREAAHEVNIPLSKSFKDRNGVERTYITYVLAQSLP
ncbi:cytochrome P450 [Rhizoctonia solani AG-1 IA]|uniref:Cytochrome P450 n=1 Tax=Thanatephorus cucumeris (strain AG1-IA) TaxID=983506 RepID=L8WM81_THACA|nr:cytochrome P450 [Rhizoctonia solani AG-1 IA]